MTTRIANVLVATALATSVAACTPQANPAEAEPPTLDVTDWSGRTELFMEYPPLVAGQTALFPVQLTRMQDFKPVTAGRVEIEFTPVAGAPPTALAGAPPSRPGVFRVEGAAPAAGRYRWALLLEAPGLAD